jgi:hypothetical protein
MSSDFPMIACDMFLKEQWRRLKLKMRNNQHKPVIHLQLVQRCRMHRIFLLKPSTPCAETRKQAHLSFHRPVCLSGHSKIAISKVPSFEFAAISGSEGANW